MEAEVIDAVTKAAADGTRLRIQGGGTRAGLGMPVKAARPLVMSGVRGITLYEPGAMTLIAQAGTQIAEIEAALSAENQELAFEPMDHRALLGSTGTPTIGGVVSAAVSGPRRMRVGACRDHLLGVRFVDGQGRVVKNGGRVMKNVTGLDLTKLICGAYGTLGVVTEVSLKTLPRAERAATLAFNGLSDSQAVGLFCKALGTPFEVSGAAFVSGRACLRIEGLDSQVSYRIDRLKEILDQADATVIEDEAHKSLWTGLRDVTHFANTPGVVWRVSVKATDAPAIALALRQKLGAETSFDWGGGLIWVVVPDAAPGDAGATTRQVVAGHGGHATLVRGSDDQREQARAFQPEAAALASLTAAIRGRFDPHNILNPGLMAA